MPKFEAPPIRTSFFGPSNVSSGARMSGIVSTPAPQPAPTQPPNRTWQKWLSNVTDRFNASPHVVSIPVASDSPGTPNELAISADGLWLYVCVAQNTWRKVALTAF